MKSRFATIIISIIIFLIICVFTLFGYIIWQEIINLQTSVEPENVKTVISSDENTIDRNIRTPEIVENPFEEIQRVESNNVEYSNVQIDKYFYNQLDEYSKTVYKAFENNKENMKTGTYKVELGNSFSALLNSANGQDLLGQYYQSAIEAYTYDNPDVFYLSPNKMYLNIETTTRGDSVTYYLYVDNGNQPNYLIDEFSSKAQIDEAINNIESIKNQIIQRRTGNAYNDIKMVHDYLVENIEYDTTLSQGNIYNIYGALINKKAVCEGYARAFKYIMDDLGIQSTLVIGKGTNSQNQTENHAWNYVQLNNRWYAIDTTWDDPVSTTGWVSNSSKYKYFLKGSTEFNKDHIPSGQFTDGGKVFNYPNISSTNYE